MATCDKSSPGDSEFQYDFRSEDSKHKNPYMWLQDKEEAVKEDKKMKIKRLPSPSPDEDIKQITKEFCEWVASLVSI